MSICLIKGYLLWSLGINILMLLLWFLLFSIAHDRIFRLHKKYFKLSVEAFDTIHYSGMGVYKLSIFLFNLVPYIALVIVC
jgi:hypothetical protein